jgi:hypothetical protein
VSERHRIGDISDTHIPRRVPRLPDDALRRFEDVQLILHAGDLSTLAVLDQLAAYAPVAAVQGNVELPDVVGTLPLKHELAVGDVAIGLIHILGDRARYARNARRDFPPPAWSSSATATSPMSRTPMACCCSTLAVPLTVAASPTPPSPCSPSKTAIRAPRSYHCPEISCVLDITLPVRTSNWHNVLIRQANAAVCPEFRGEAEAREGPHDIG